MNLLFLFSFASIIVNVITRANYYPRYFPKVGVLLEPDGVVVPYEETRFVTFVYQMANIPKVISPGCHHLKEVINNELDHVRTHMEFLLSIIPDTSRDLITDFCEFHNNLCHKEDFLADNKKQTNGNTSKPLKKRSIMAVAAISGLVGLGNTIYTWYTGNKVNDHINNVEENLRILQNKEYQDRGKINDLVVANNDLIKRTSINIKHLKDIINQKNCDFDTKFAAINMQMLKDRFLREVEGLINMMNGNLDPILVHSETISKILKSDSSLTDSILNSNRGLIISLSKSNLIYTDLGSKQFVFLIEIPVIAKHMYSPLFKVYNGGWEIESTYHKLDLPENFYMYAGSEDMNYHAVSHIHENCYLRNGIYICDNSKYYLRKEMICMNSLLKDEEYDNCDILLTRQKQKIEMFKTKSGVFITGKPEVTSIHSVGDSFQMIKDKILSENYTQFYPYKTFSKLIVDSVIIVSNDEKVPVIYSYNNLSFPVDLKYASVHKILLENSWTPLPHLQQLLNEDNLGTLSFGYKTFDNHAPIVVILVLLILVPVIWFLIKTRRSLKKNIKDNKRTKMLLVNYLKR